MNAARRAEASNRDPSDRTSGRWCRGRGDRESETPGIRSQGSASASPKAPGPDWPGSLLLGPLAARGGPERTTSWGARGGCTGPTHREPVVPGVRTSESATPPSGLSKPGGAEQPSGQQRGPWPTRTRTRLAWKLVAPGPRRTRKLLDHQHLGISGPVCRALAPGPLELGVGVWRVAGPARGFPSSSSAAPPVQPATIFLASPACKPQVQKDGLASDRDAVPPAPARTSAPRQAAPCSARPPLVPRAALESEWLEIGRVPARRDSS
jgi:hypothetical protein